MFIENFGKRSYLAIHPCTYGQERHGKLFFLWQSLRAIIQGQPERLLAAYIKLRQASPVDEPKISGVEYGRGPGGMVGLTFELESGYGIGVWLREADWHAVASRVKGVTKEGYMSAEDHGDPDLNTNSDVLKIHSTTW